jgi:bifunctional NMN adenylyltransferase/nudix hydrolase
MNTQKQHEILVASVVGRFMLPHEAHVGLIRVAIEALKAALAEGRAKQVKLAVVLGSAYHARTPKNPFTWVERKNMLLAALTPKEREMVVFIPVRDYHDDDRWARVVHRKVVELFGAGAHVQVFGHYKDSSSAYLNDCFKQWEVVAVPRLGDLDATTLRAMLFSGEDDDITLSALEGAVPDGVRKYLKVWMQQPCYGALKKEFKVLQEERRKYGIGPFVAGDVIIRTKHHVLLIKRGGAIGKGLYALPGGFLESKRRETHRQCAEREGFEETNMGIIKSVLAAAHRGFEVYDHPDRSVRGNVISFSHFYDLNTETCPQVEPGDDAGEAMWVLIEELRGMEELFFDDHFLQLDQRFGLLGEDE